MLCRVVIEENDKVLDCWKGMRSEMRKFIAAVLFAIDVLSAEITEMDVEDVHEK